MTTETTDIVIVGGGVLGLTCALELSERSPTTTVTVLSDPDRAGASNAAGAMLGCFGEVTASSLRSTAGRRKLALNHVAKALWPGLLERLDLPRPAGGTVVLANARSGTMEDDNFAAIVEAAAEYRERLEPIDAADVIALRPAEDSRPSRCLFLPDEGYVDARRLLDALRGALDRRPSVERAHGRVVRVEVEASGVRAVGLADGRRINTHVCVLAAGAETQTLLDGLAERVPGIPRMLSGTGSAISLAARSPRSPHVLRTPNRSFACGLHVVPSADGTIYVGATNEAHWEPRSRPTVTDVHFLMTCAMEQIDHGLYDAELVRTHTGNRPVSFDTYPLLGRTTADGLWLVTGTYREGLHLAPWLSASLCREILDGVPSFPPEFAPQRRPISAFTREDAIAEAVKHYLAVGWEHGICVPSVGWHGMLAEMITRQVCDVYDRIGSDYTIAPDLISMIDVDRERLVPLVRAEIDRLQRS